MYGSGHGHQPRHPDLRRQRGRARPGLVVERASELRGGGYAVDFRGAAHLSVLAKMGILDAITARQTRLSATTIVDQQGRAVARMPAHVFAGDVEILRGDLAHILYEATQDTTEYLFGDSISMLGE